VGVITFRIDSHTIKRGDTITIADKTKKSQNLGGSKTSRICNVYGTHKEITQQETTESSLIDMQEKEKKQR
jgi:hypothetical protein